MASIKKNKQLLFCLITLLFLNIQSQAQETQLTAIQNDKISLGLGFGLDMGGVGINLLAYPNKNIGLFIGSGFALAGLGINGGIKLRPLSKKLNSKFCPYAIGMYGYNAAIYVKDAIEYNKIFYGPSIGIGCDLRSKGKEGYWSVAVLLPFRKTDEIDSYMKDLEDNHQVQFDLDKNSFPLTFSIAYRIIGK